MIGTAIKPFTAFNAAVCRWSTVAIGASIPVSIALDNVLLSITLAAWLFGMQHRQKLQMSWDNPVYRAALILFSVLLFGTVYAQTSPGDAKLYLLKYADLALIPVLGWAFVKTSAREVAIRVLACSLAAVLLISCALKIGLLPPQPWLRGTPESPFVVFKLRLTHNILMAYAAFAFAWLSCSSDSRHAKLGWGVLAALPVINVTLIVEGTTGYVLLIALVLLFGWQRARLKGIGIALVAVLTGVALLSVVPGPFQTRIKEIGLDIRTERANRPASTSTGYRMEFYRNTLQLVGQSPLFGSGTGSFPSAYAALVAGTGQQPSHNPHNEFLLIAVQTGALGLAAFLWLLWQQWRLAPQLPTVLERSLAQGTVVTIVVVSMFNSTLLDHTEGLFYAWMTALLYAGLPAKPLPQTA